MAEKAGSLMTLAIEQIILNNRETLGKVSNPPPLITLRKLFIAKIDKS